MTTDAINHDPGAHVHEHRLADRRPARAWARGSPTASAARRRICRASSCSRRSGKGGQNQPIAARQWSAGFLAEPVSGRASPQQGRPVLYLSNPPGVLARACRATSSTRSTDSTRSHDAIGRRSGDRDAHRAVRDGVQDAGQRAELMDMADEPQHDPRALRLPARRRLVRLELPAGPPPRRARRALHPALSQGLGPPRRREGRRGTQGRRRSTAPAWP